MQLYSTQVKFLAGAGALAFLALALLAAPQTSSTSSSASSTSSRSVQHYGRDWTIKQDQPPVEQTFNLGSSSPAQIDVDDVRGNIQVVGDAGVSTVRMVARETIWGEFNDDIDRAKKEVHLDAGQHDNGVRLYVDGPFRCSDNCEHWGSRGYNVAFDFELHVPPNAQVDLRTVNDGDISLQRTSGSFTVRNLNGDLELTDVSGAGEARTVNGKIEARYKSNPTGDCTFTTVNGSIHLYFQPNLSADVSYRTVNGSIYTDFDTTQLPMTGDVTESRQGMRLYRTNRDGRVRIGQGGPLIKLDEVNGSIYVHKAK